MKLNGESCELVTEYAKDLVWENNFDRLTNQLCVLSEQCQRLYRLIGKVKYIITDGPLLMQILYNVNPLNRDEINNLIVTLFNNFDNINIMLDRDLTRPYDPVGRLQTFEEACKVDEECISLLNTYDIPYHHCKASVETVYGFMTENILNIK